MESEVARVVALGASNLTRGFRAVLSVARAAWGPEVHLLAACAAIASRPPSFRPTPIGRAACRSVSVSTGAAPGHSPA